MQNISGNHADTWRQILAADFPSNHFLSGVEKDTASKALGTHWAVKVWRDGNIWGAHFTCQELPHLNSLSAAAEGVEKCIDEPIAGGKAKVNLNQGILSEGEGSVPSTSLF